MSGYSVNKIRDVPLPEQCLTPMFIDMQWIDVQGNPVESSPAIDNMLIQSPLCPHCKKQNIRLGRYEGSVLRAMCDGCKWWGFMRANHLNLDGSPK